MEDLIDRKKLLEIIQGEENISADTLQYERYVDMVKIQPSVDAVPISLISKKLAEILSCPCNWTPLDEIMTEICNDSCPSDTIDSECWEKVIKEWKK